MNTLPKALLLAEMIDSNEVCVDWDKDAAAELRRLHEVNQMLVEASGMELEALEDFHTDGYRTESCYNIITALCQALAKAKEQA